MFSMFDATTLSAAIKANGDLSLEIVGLPFGADRQGQVFDASTNIDLSVGDAINVYHYHGFAEIASKSVGRIGTAIYKGIGTLNGITGHLFGVALDAAKGIAQRIYADAQQGRARASSDSSSHLVRPAGIVGKPGKVTNWPIFAMSLMDAETADAAVNPRAIALAAAKAFISNELDTVAGEAEAAKAGATFARRNRDRITSIKAMLDEMMGEFPTEPTEGAQPAAAKSIEVIQEMSDINVEQIAADVAAVVAPEVPATPEPVQPAPAVKTYTREEVEQIARDAATAAAKSVHARRPVMGAPTVIRAKTGEAKPLYWATKAALRTGGSVTLRDADEGLEFLPGTEGSADEAFKAFKSYAEAANVEMSGNVIAAKAMATTSGSSTGEHFIPRIQTNRVIEGLYQVVVSRQLNGVEIFPMPGLVCDAPVIGTFTAGWSAENANSTASGDATTGRKTLIAKNLTAWGELSNQLLADSYPGVEAYVRNGLALAMGEVHDTGAIQGTGLSNQPTGLLTESGPTSTGSSQNIYEDILDAIGRMAGNKIPFSNNNINVVMHPVAAIKALKTKISGTDYIASGQQLTNPNMGGTQITQRLSDRLGVPVFTTTAVPVTTGTSPVLVLHGPSWTIGDRQELEIASSNVAGDSFKKNQTYIRAIMRVDFNLKRAAGLEVIIGFIH